MLQSDLNAWHQCDEMQTVISQEDQLQINTSEIIIPQKKGKSYKINTSNARGELKLLRKIISRNGWKEVFSDGDICWLGLPFKYDNLDEYFIQRVNRFPGMDMLAHKGQTSFYLNKFYKYFPGEYEFYPRSFCLPEECEEFKTQFNKNKLYISKPDAGSQGEGIYLIRQLKDVRGGESVVVQEYIDRPLLIDKKKFDLRLYVLVTSVDPMIAFINHEGLARFCTVDYEKPSMKNLGNAFMHLTNYSLNKRSVDFKHTDNNYLEINDNTKRTYTSIKKNLELQGYNIKEIDENINELVVSFLKALYPFLIYNSKMVFQNKWEETKSFHILGFDILLDEQGKPWLLEVNSNPSLSIDHEVFGKDAKSIFEESEIDAYVKGLVVSDAIRIVMKKKERQLELEEFNSYSRLPTEAGQDSVIAKMLKVYGFISGYKFNETITSSKFQKLCKFPNMVTDKFMKIDYDLTFRKILLKSGANSMDFFNFVTALELLALKLGEEVEQMMNRLVANL